MLVGRAVSMFIQGSGVVVAWERMSYPVFNQVSWLPRQGHVGLVHQTDPRPLVGSQAPVVKVTVAFPYYSGRFPTGPLACVAGSPLLFLHLLLDPKVVGEHCPSTCTQGNPTYFKQLPTIPTPPRWPEF